MPPGREGFRAWQRIGTRWSDNDVYGHVNNTIYYQWFDSAVNAMLVAAGLLALLAVVALPVVPLLLVAGLVWLAVKGTAALAAA